MSRISPPTSMKFSASRSLLHGTVCSGRTRIAASTARTCGSNASYRSGRRKPRSRHDLEIARLDREHVEVLQEAAAGVQAPARLRNRGEAVAAPQLLGVHHLALEEAEHERVVLWQRGDERRADAGLGRRDRVVQLVLAVDREEARVLARDADDVAPGGARHLVVRVRQAARERLDRGRVAQLRHRVEDRLDGHRAILLGSRPNAPRTCPRRRHRRRRHRLLVSLPPGEGGLDGFRPRRAVPAHARLDVALGRARRPAALVDLADADDAVLGRPVRRAEGADRQRSGLAPARRPAARVLAAAPRGDPPPGVVGEDVRPADGDRLRGGGAGALPADERRRRARCSVHPRRRLSRPEPAHVRARRRRAPSRRADRGAHARHRHRDARRPRVRGRDGQGPDRVRGRRRRGRHVRAPGCRVGRRRRADHPVRPPVPRHRAVRARAGSAADAARPGQPHLLPDRGRRSRHGRLRAQAGAVGARRHPRRLRSEAPPAGVGADGGAVRERDPPRSGDGERRGEDVLQRPGGVHARRRLPARRDGRAGVLDRRRRVRARPRRRGRGGEDDERVDRRRPSRVGRVAARLAPLRPPVPQPRVHARALVRGALAVLRHQVPR